MSNDQIIQTKTEELAQNQEPFTSVDVANAIKKEGTWVRNREVAQWLRSNFQAAGYQKSQIAVIGNRAATLYHPDIVDAENYDETEQDAMSKPEFDKLFPNQAQNTASQVSSSAPQQTLSKGLKVSSYSTRIRIPAAIVKQLNWQPGDAVDALKVQTKIPVRKLKVWSDGRISIAKRLIPGSGKKVDIKVENGKLKLELL